MFYVILLVLILIVVWVIKSSPIETHSHWEHSFNNLQFSSMEFYKLVEDSIRKHEIPSVTFSRVTHFQAGIFSSKREYLRVSRDEYIFDICAAPFGKDFFVSWWLGESLRSVLARIPFINTLIGKNSKIKSFYQQDTEAMFRASVTQGLMEAIDGMTTLKGIRALSEMERQSTDAKK